MITKWVMALINWVWRRIIRIYVSQKKKQAIKGKCKNPSRKWINAGKITAQKRNTRDCNR